jgi:hypothetical protein
VCKRAERACAVRILDLEHFDVVTRVAHELRLRLHNYVFATGLAISNVYMQDAHRRMKVAALPKPKIPRSAVVFAVP